MNIYLVRHGEQVEMDGGWSIETINPYLSGRKERCLSERGRGQAEAVSRFLSDRGIGRVFSSNYIRCKESAQSTAAAVGADIEVVEGLGEINVGRMRAGSSLRYVLNAGEAARRLRQWIEPVTHPLEKGVAGIVAVKYFADWLLGRTSGGEDVRGAVHRVTDALALLAEAAEHAPVAVFTHGYFIITAGSLCAMGDRQGIGRMLSPWIVRNGSITTLRSGDGPPALQLLSFARAGHLNR